MNWIKQNKFLSGFIAVMVIGVGALGFLLFQAQSRYGEARTEYESKATELNRLEGLKPYPENENLKLIEAQKGQFVATISEFRKSIAAAQIPLEPISREQFQDKLREAVTRISAKAKEGGLALPPMFYVGMEKYQSEPPLPEAAPVLARELKALEFVIAKMVEEGITAITKFERDLLPEEEGKGKKEKETSGKSGVGGKPEKSAKNAVAYHGVQIEFTAEQSRFRNFLNAVVTEKSQLYVPRLVVVKNEKDAAPPRVSAEGQPGGAQTPGADAGDTKYTFGAERVNVSLVLDIVDFAEVAAK